MSITGVKTAVVRGAWLVVAGVLAASAGVMSYRFVRADVESQVYRERLSELVDDYERLQSRYNEAVRRSAVTELLVREGRLSVLVRTSEGVIREVETPYDPSGEVYVDYAVLDGRLWIRRVFDERTAPGKGLMIDPDLREVDWDAPGAGHGKAVYRRLGEGRWVVTVTGGGAVGLARVGDAEEVRLVGAPEVREYAEMEEEVARYARELTFGDVLRRLAGR